MTQASGAIRDGGQPLDYASATERELLPVDTGPSLKHRAIRGSMWTTLGYGASQVIRLGSNLVLTRLLAPELFGLMGLVNVFIQGLVMFSDVGIGPSIVQNPRGAEPRFYRTAWTIQVIRGIGLWCAAAGLAWPVAWYYKQPAMLWLLPVVGLNALLGGFYGTTFYQFQRRLQYGKLTLLELAVQIVSIGTMLVCAYFWRNVWSLVAGGAAAAVFTLVATHLLNPGPRHWFAWDAESRRALLHFGRWIFVSTILAFLSQQSDRLIFARMVPLSLFGIYSGIALTLGTMPTAAVLKIGNSIAFSAYSRVQHEPERFQRAFGRVRWPLVTGGALVVTGLIACGAPLVRVLYDPRYWAAGWMLQVVAIAAWFQILDCTCGAALLARGKVHWIAAGSAAKLACMIVLLPLGAWVHRKLGGDGFLGAIAGLAAADAMRYLTVAVGVGLMGLRIFWGDAVLTVSVFGIGLAGHLAGGHLHGLAHNRRAGDALVVLIVGLATCVIWLPVLWKVWRRAYRT